MAKPVQKTTKSSSGKASTTERRRSSRRSVKLLTAFRMLEPNPIMKDGFARALSLSKVGAQLETPDHFTRGQKMELEFLLDDNKIARLKGVIVRVDTGKDFNKVSVEFEKVPAKIARWIEQQTEG